MTPQQTQQAPVAKSKSSHTGARSWGKVTLGDLCDIARGGSPRPIERFLTQGAGYNWLRIGDTAGVSKYIYTTKQRIKEEGLSKTRVVDKGDFILSNSMSFGKPFIMKTKACIHDGWLVLTIKRPTELSDEFLYYLLSSDWMFRNFSKGAAGSSVRNLKIDLVKAVSILLPPIQEQKAIAGILQKWDEAIEKVKALISAKQKQFEGFSELLIGKKQYMNEGTKSKLGDLFRIYSYPSKNKSINSNGERVIVDMGAVSRTGDLIASKRTDINEDILQVNDLVMPKDDIGGGNIIGKVAIIDVAGKYVCGDHVYRLVQKGGIDASYFRFLINCYPVNKRLRASANGTSQLGLSKHDVAKQQVCFPPLPEQKRIAHILTTAQCEIGLLKQLVDRYHTQKRGLMQKLLTGEWRGVK